MDNHTTGKQLSPWQQWAIGIEQKLHSQAEHITKLEQYISVLQKQLIELQSNNSPTYRIDKIEYRFDQLKIETLEGTLQIGMTTGSNQEPTPTQIEQLAISNQKAPPKTNITPAKTGGNEAIQMKCESDLSSYIQQDAKKLLRSEAEKKNITIEDNHIDMVVRDLLSQIPNRIHYYASKQLQHDNRTLSPNELDQIQHLIINKTKSDIVKAIQDYITSLPLK